MPAVAGVFKALSEPTRLEILLALSPNGRAVYQVVERTALSQPLVSHHLAVLRDAGLVRAERKGNHVFYGWCSPALEHLVQDAAQISREVNETRHTH